MMKYELTNALTQQIAKLEQRFKVIANTKMLDIPICNAALSVSCVDFEVVEDNLDDIKETKDAASLTAKLWGQGVLITPWCMNVMRFPWFGNSHSVLKLGEKGERVVWQSQMEFIGGVDDVLGAYESSSLFSPVFEFATQAQAIETAKEVLRQLKLAPSTSTNTIPQRPELSRRSFLFGRGA